MRRLQIPLDDIEQRTIFQSCADSFRDKTALAYLEKAVLSADEYRKYVPRKIGNLSDFEIDEKDKKKILKVYTEKFSKQKSVGRKYYDAIMANANGRCPICGSGKLKNLDHFLPKSKYPLLCVDPANLIPTCRDCNFDKEDKFVANYYSIPFHPYFDDIKDLWLECIVSFKNDNTYEIIYINAYDKSIDINMWNKYETHFRVYDLNSTYSARACDEMETCKEKNKRLLNNCGTEGVERDLFDNKVSCEHNDINSWKAALYRELVRKHIEYCEWLNTLR